MQKTSTIIVYFLEKLILTAKLETLFIFNQFVGCNSFAGL